MQSGHSRLGSDAPQYTESESGGTRGDNVVPSSGPSAEARRKLDQIVQVSLLFEGLYSVCMCSC